ncbi:MAG: phospholipase D-like domain-containing protein [Nitrospiraceae bacterium]|nr:phospholipase D-like domain-containing protein [Nitrospiraceae bacterium]
MGNYTVEEGFISRDIEYIYRDRFAPGNNVELLWKGTEAFNRIFEAVRAARSFVCLEFYIYRNDDTGRELAEILKQKAGEGVKVYILYDHFGSFGTPRSFWRGLAEAGVRIGASYVFKFDSPLRYIHRDHRKLIIIDGQSAFTGGLNIANEYRGLHLRMKKGWRDTGVFIKGPAAKALLGKFRKSWRLWGKGPLDAGLPAPPDAAGGPLSVIPIFAGSGKGRRRLRRLLYYSINHAKKSIFLTTAYFCPSRRMIETLEAAARRGVEVKLLLQGHTDVPVAKYAGMMYYDRLLRAGIEIHHYLGQVLHAKTYVFDLAWSIVGSANLDFQSLRWNDEGNVGILDEGFAGMLCDVFHEDLSNAEQVVLDKWRRRPLADKIKERVFSLIRRRL